MSQVTSHSTQRKKGFNTHLPFLSWSLGIQLMIVTYLSNLHEHCDHQSIPFSGGGALREEIKEKKKVKIIGNVSEVFLK